MRKFSALILATSIVLVAGCSKKEKPVKPDEEMAKAPDAGKKAEHAKPEEAAKASETPAAGRGSQ